MKQVRKSANADEFSIFSVLHATYINAEQFFDYEEDPYGLLNDIIEILKATDDFAISVIGLLTLEKILHAGILSGFKPTYF